MACEIVLANTQVIIIYDSAIVHSQHLALLSTTYTNIQRIRSVFPAISSMLAQRLAATQSASHHIRTTSNCLTTPPPVGPLQLYNTIAVQIRHLTPCDRQWNPTKHTTTIGHQLYVKIKSHQFRPNAFPKYHFNPNHASSWSTVTIGWTKRVSSPMPAQSTYHSHYPATSHGSPHLYIFIQ